MLCCLPHRDSLFEWRWDSRKLSPALPLETPGGVMSDAGLQVFADDVFERRVVISGDADEAFAIMERSGELFDQAMEERGYVPKAGKRVVIPELRSPLENRKLQQLITTGDVCAAARHLGGQYSRTGTNKYEIQKRLSQITAVWCEIGKFWHSEASFAAKRNAFIRSIQGAALAGLTSYVLLDAEKETVGH